MAVLAGLLATAFIEPLLDEYRLATLFGVSIGMLRATATSMHATGRLPNWRVPVDRLRPAAEGVPWT